VASNVRLALSSFKSSRLAHGVTHLCSGRSFCGQVTYVEKTFMRIILAALLTAAAAMRSFASEAPSLPDPTDAAASVPAESVPSVTGAYQPFQDKPVASWPELNNAVATPAKRRGVAGMPGMGGMDHSGMSAPTATRSVKTDASSSDGQGQMNHDGAAGMDHSQMSPKAVPADKAGAAGDNKKRHMNHEGMHE
jgi:hypothetical protein